jgi:hypothetical protein
MHHDNQYPGKTLFDGGFLIAIYPNLMYYAIVVCKLYTLRITKIEQLGLFLSSLTNLKKVMLTFTGATRRVSAVLQILPGECKKFQIKLFNHSIAYTSYYQIVQTDATSRSYYLMQMGFTFFNENSQNSSLKYRIPTDFCQFE